MILLDTCAILWDALDPSQLSKKAVKAIQSADQNDTLAISDISLWEIAMLMKKGRIRIDASPAGFLRLFLQSRNVIIHAITPEIAEQSVDFGQESNTDPADRIIAATSVVYKAPLVTADRNLLGCKRVNTIW